MGKTITIREILYEKSDFQDFKSRPYFIELPGGRKTLAKCKVCGRELNGVPWTFGGKKHPSLDFYDGTIVTICADCWIPVFGEFTYSPIDPAYKVRIKPKSKGEVIEGYLFGSLYFTWIPIVLLLTAILRCDSTEPKPKNPTDEVREMYQDEYENRRDRAWGY